MKLQEKMAAIALGDSGESLEGTFLAGASGDERGAVIAPPHPLYGGSMESPVVAEVAFACHRAGIATLRFNWRGVGASAGEPSGEERDADDDYGAALMHLAETVPGALLACGYSFGSAAAVRAAERSPRVRRLVLVAPPPQLIAPARIAALRARVLVVTGDRDHFVPLPALKDAFASAANVTLRVLPGVDHFFMNGLSALGREVHEWLGGVDGTSAP
jgi:alpha/beta superfamily hydrolase